MTIKFCFLIKQKTHSSFLANKTCKMPGSSAKNLSKLPKVPRNLYTLPIGESRGDTRGTAVPPLTLENNDKKLKLGQKIEYVSNEHLMGLVLLVGEATRKISGAWGSLAFESPHIYILLLITPL